MNNKILLIIAALSVFVCGEEVNAASADLNQTRNGSDNSPVSPMNWVNGNLGSSQAHFAEGMSIPFQCIMTGLTIGVQASITIGYDIRRNGKNAYDFITHYNRIMPHTFPLHSTPETIDPLLGSGLPSSTPFSLSRIPAPGSLYGVPTNVYNWYITDSEKQMTLYNGTIDTIYYLVQGDLLAFASETQVVVKFTPSAANAVLLWGGHIASRDDWGYTNGIPNSAGGIGGSPFHMRLISWSYGSLGSQDRSVAGGSVMGPLTPSTLPITLINFSAENIPEGVQLNWTTSSEINNDYFTLERFKGNENFETVGMVDGAGNSNSLLNYSYLDRNPEVGIAYYYLVQTDFDGTKKGYGPIYARTGDSRFSLSLVNIYPNPTTGDFYLTYRSENRCETLFEILNAEGKRMYVETLHSQRGTNFIEIKNNTLPAKGIYFARLSQDKVKSQAERIVKK
jgi:hypothetical protein